MMNKSTGRGFAPGCYAFVIYCRQWRHSLGRFSHGRADTCRLSGLSAYGKLARRQVQHPSLPLARYRGKAYQFLEPVLSVPEKF
jgi:hypothetical protein